MSKVVTNTPHRKVVPYPIWFWASLGLTAWVFFLRFQDPSFAAGDSGETVTAAAILGITHPPGQPLVSLLGRMALFFPLGTAAFRVDLLSSLAAILSAITLGVWCQKSLGHPDLRSKGWLVSWVGFISFLALLGSSMVMENALSAKGSVYTLTLLWLVLLFSSIRWDEPARARDVLRWSFFLGLAFATHWPSALLGGIYGLVWMLDGRYKNIKLWVYGAVAFLCGLSVYLYLPLRAVRFPALDWGHPATWDAFMWLVSRSAYAEWSQSNGAWLSASQSFWGLGRAVLSSFPGAFLGLVGLWGWKGRSARSGWGYGLAVLAPVVGIAFFPRLLPESLYLVSVYWTPFQGLWVFLSVMGLWTLWSDLEGGRKKWRWALPVVVAASAVLWWPRVDHLDPSRDWMPRDLGVNLLQSLPKGAVFFPEGDTPIVSLFQARWVEDKRPDVYVFPAVFLGERWGFDRALKDLGLPASNFKAPQTPEERLTWVERAVGLDGLGPKRPVLSNLQDGWCGRSFSGTEVGFEPSGMVFRLAPTRNDPEAVRRSVWEALRHQSRRGLTPGTESSRSTDFYAYYSDPLLLSGNQAQQAGRLMEACDDYAGALEVNPKSVEACSDLAVVVAAMGMPEMGEDFCWKAVGLNPRYTPAWHNLGNVYSVLGEWDQAMDAYGKVLALRPDSSATRQNQAIASMMRSKNAPAQVPTHDAAWYGAQAERFKAEGRKVLAGMAEETSKRLGERH